MLTNYKFQLDFNLILDISPVKQGIRQFWTLTKYSEYSLFRALMSLTYFEDAENQLMPKMFIDVAWEEIKDTIRKEVERISL